MSRLKSGDLVEVVSGAEKGKRGKVLRVDRSSRRITVQGVNMVKRHQRILGLAKQSGSAI